MRIGLCTTDFPYVMPAKELFRKVRDIGFDAVQLAFASVSECRFTPSAHIEIPDSVPDAALDAIREASEETGVAIGAVNGTWNMAHPDPAVREEALGRFEDFLEAVSALDCPIVSLCSGTRSPEGLWTGSDKNGTPDAWRDMLDSMKQAAALAEKYGITLAIETEAGNVIDTPDKARRVMDEVGSFALKMVLDAANLFHKGEAHPENVRPALDLAMDRFGADVVLAHGKDIREGDGIDFCGTGSGIVDFPYMIAGLRRQGFAGDMMLHGILDEARFEGCRRFMEECMKFSAGPSQSYRL